MSTTITLEEAQAKLSELIARLGPGDRVVIVQNPEGPFGAQIRSHPRLR